MNRFVESGGGIGVVAILCMSDVTSPVHCCDVVAGASAASIAATSPRCSPAKDASTRGGGGGGGAAARGTGAAAGMGTGGAARGTGGGGGRGGGRGRGKDVERPRGGGGGGRVGARRRLVGGGALDLGRPRRGLRGRGRGRGLAHPREHGLHLGDAGGAFLGGALERGEFGLPIRARAGVGGGVGDDAVADGAVAAAGAGVRPGETRATTARRGVEDARGGADVVIAPEGSSGEGLR